MVTQKVTNEDLLEVMQDMMNGMGKKFQHLEKRLARIDQDLQIIKAKLLEHDLQLADLRRIVQELTDKHSAYINDIADILDRIVALERHSPNITKEEVYELQQMLQRLVDWAIKAAKTVKIPLKLP